MAAHLGALRVLLGWRSRETVVERGGNLIRLEVPGRQQGSSLSGRAGVVWKPPHPTGETTTGHVFDVALLHRCKRFTGPSHEH